TCTTSACSPGSSTDTGWCCTRRTRGSASASSRSGRTPGSPARCATADRSAWPIEPVSVRDSDLDDRLVHGDAVVVDDRGRCQHLTVVGEHELDAHDGPESNEVPDAFIGVITVHLDDPAVLARHSTPLLGMDMPSPTQPGGRRTGYDETDRVG